MPRVKRRAKARRRPPLEISHMEELTLGFACLGVDCGFGDDVEWKRESWEIHRAELLSESEPGTRPAGWWDFESPGPRRRIGGTGEAMPGAVLRLGVPRGFRGYDPSDPPTYETQADYLKRHGLLTHDEREAFL